MKGTMKIAIVGMTMKHLECALKLKEAGVINWLSVNQVKNDSGLKFAIKALVPEENLFTYFKVMAEV